MFKKTNKSNEKKPTKQFDKIALELHQGYIKISALNCSEGENTFSFITKKFSSPDEDTVISEIKSTFEENHFSRDSVLVNIPKTEVMTKMLYLPSTKNDELSNMVKIEASKMMPESEDRLIVDYKTIKLQENGYSENLVAIVQQDLVETVLRILEKANINVENIALGSEALFSWYMMINEEQINQENASIINIDFDQININIVEKGNLIFTRGFSCGGKNIFANRQIIVDEIGKSIVVCCRRKHLKIDKVYLTGSTKQVKEFYPFLEKKLKSEISVVLQEKNIKIETRLSKSQLEKKSFVELIGLSLKREAISINLLPEKSKLEKKAKIIKKKLVTTAILSTVLIFMLIAFAVNNTLNKYKMVQLLDSKIKDTKLIAQEAEEMKNKLLLFKREIDKKPVVVTLISEIHKIVPVNIKLNLLDFKDKGSFVLRGNAGSLKEVLKCMSAMEKSDYFENVKVRYTRQRTVSKQNVTDFEIVCQASL